MKRALRKITHEFHVNMMWTAILTIVISSLGHSKWFLALGFGMIVFNYIYIIFYIRKLEKRRKLKTDNNEMD
jgi:hypothetical protein